MTNFIPIFPLGIVVYPGESVNLHIFEPRYKQLINECNTQNKPFGIPSVIDNILHDYGTIIRITEITTVQENGEMDIKTRGEEVFRVLEVIKEIPEKLYCGAIVTYPDNNVDSGNPEIMRKLTNSIKELHRLLNIQKDFQKDDSELNVYDVAHHIGLTIQEEFEILHLFDERQRQEYVKRHLTKVIPMLAQMEKLKEKIKLNGHFKNLESLNFDL